MVSLKFKMCVAGLVVRLALISYGKWHGASNPRIPYTDVDYWVFTDASGAVAAGGSPYERATYRYSPILAYALLPGEYMNMRETFGKVFFACWDVAVGALTFALAESLGLTRKRAALLSACWFFNPMAINVATRGNADAIICALILLSAWLLHRKRLALSGIVYGLAVHMRIYPVIFAPTFLLLLSDESSARALGYSSRIGCVATFAGAALAAFCIVTVPLWLTFGQEFLEHTYLYHFRRIDTRHNFSPYFYGMYLDPSSRVWPLAFALSQCAVQLSISWRYSRDVLFCFCLQTWAFVAFNKVCTAQYFLWYLSLLPSALPSLQPSWLWKGLAAAGFWFAAELHWLWFAYRLEFRAEQVFKGLWAASIVFFLANIVAMRLLMSAHKGGAHFRIFGAANSIKEE